MNWAVFFKMKLKGKSQETEAIPFALSEERGSHQSSDSARAEERAHAESASEVYRGEERSRPSVWVILLCIALITLILTIIFGYFALGPGDTLKYY